MSETKVQAELTDLLIELCKQVAVDRASDVANVMLEYEEREKVKMAPNLAIYVHNMIWALEMEVVLKHIVINDDEQESGRKRMIGKWLEIQKDILEQF